MNITMIRWARISFGLESDPTPPTEEVPVLATEASMRVSRLIGTDPRETYVMRFATAPEEPVVSPAAAVRLLRALLTELASGNAVTPVAHRSD